MVQAGRRGEDRVSDAKWHGRLDGRVKPGHDGRGLCFDTTVNCSRHAAERGSKEAAVDTLRCGPVGWFLLASGGALAVQHWLRDSENVVDETGDGLVLAVEHVIAGDGAERRRETFNEELGLDRQLGREF